MWFCLLLINLNTDIKLIHIHCSFFVCIAKQNATLTIHKAAVSHNRTIHCRITQCRSTFVSDMKWLVHQLTGISLKLYPRDWCSWGRKGERQFSFSWRIKVGDGEKEWHTPKINAIKFIYQHSPQQLQHDLYKHSECLQHKFLIYYSGFPSESKVVSIILQWCAS